MPEPDGKRQHCQNTREKKLKGVRVATTALSEAGRALADDVNRVTAALAALPDRQTEVQEAITHLSQSAAAVGVLARHALVAHRILRSPLWFFGR